jgi:ABC-type branched-subunit amino acid transport system permease subunit
MLFVVLLLLPTAQLRFSRAGGAQKHPRVSTVRDTTIGMAVLFVVMAALSTQLSVLNMSRFTLAMCSALVALSLVPLIGWAGQVSLAPLAFAGIGATVYARNDGQARTLLPLVICAIATALIAAYAARRIRGMPLPLSFVLGGIGIVLGGVLYLVLGGAYLAALACMPIGALLAFPAMRLQGLYLALATMAFAIFVDKLWYTQEFAAGSGRLLIERIELFGMEYTGNTSFLLLVTAIFGILSIGIVAMRRSPFGRRLIALRDSEAASATVGVSILETKITVFALSAGLSGFAGVFLVQYKNGLAYGETNGFTMLVGLGIVLSLVIGGAACVSGALFAGIFGLVLILIRDLWHLDLWETLAILGPGLAAIGIINNPAGAVVAIGEGFAPLLPWREDARREAAELKEANAEPEVGELGLARPFDDADVLLVDRGLGISNDVPRPVMGAP